MTNLTPCAVSRQVVLSDRSGTQTWTRYPPGRWRAENDPSASVQSRRVVWGAMIPRSGTSRDRSTLTSAPSIGRPFPSTTTPVTRPTESALAADAAAGATSSVAAAPGAAVSCPSGTAMDATDATAVARRRRRMGTGAPRRFGSVHPGGDRRLSGRTDRRGGRAKGCGGSRPAATPTRRQIGDSAAIWSHAAPRCGASGGTPPRPAPFPVLDGAPMTDQSPPVNDPADVPPAEQTSPPPPPATYSAYPAPPPGAVAAYGGATGPVGKVRSTGVCILLYIVTLGIYGWFWYYSVHREMKDHSGRGLGGGVALVLAIFVGIVMPYITSAEVGGLYEARGQQKPVSAATGLWAFPGVIIIVGPIIWFVKTNA